jgi:hypothetical protein
MPTPDLALARYFADLPDPRIDRTKKPHRLAPGAGCHQQRTAGPVHFRHAHGAAQN